MPSLLRLRNFVLAVLVLELLSAPPLRADGTAVNWAVTKATGDVWLLNGTAPEVPLGATKVLATGQGVRTGPNGRVLLSRGADTIMVAPKTHVVLPADPLGGKETLILHRAGELLLNVEKRATPSVHVHTPYLTALVKGTVFTVAIEATKASLSVQQGVVHVADPRSGKHVHVASGQTASTWTDSKGGLYISGSGQLDTIQDGSAFAALDPIEPETSRAAESPKAGAAPLSEPSPAAGGKLTLMEILLAVAIGAIAVVGYAVTALRSRSSRNLRA